MGDLTQFTGALVIFFVALIPAFVVHEYAHARVAVAMGDPTPRYEGRLTLNPLAHLDPIGILMLWFFSFGWAKPVGINPHRFENPRLGQFYVSIAGPGANILMALLGQVLLYWLDVSGMTYNFIKMFTMINFSLAAFNLVPIPPLDGSKILASLLPPREADAFYRLEPYGWVILLLLLWSGFIGNFIRPISHFLSWVLIPVSKFIAGLLP